jgi:hypothetical protein
MNLYSRGAHAVGREWLPWVRTSRGVQRGGADASGARTGGANVGARLGVGRVGHVGCGACGGANGRGTRGVRGPHGPWGANGRGRPRPRGDHGNGAPMCAPPVGGAYEARTAAATWFVGACTYAPSNGGAHVSSEEGINGVTLLISRCQVFSSLLLA